MKEASHLNPRNTLLLRPAAKGAHAARPRRYLGMSRNEKMRHWTNPPSCPNRAVNMHPGGACIPIIKNQVRGAPVCASPRVMKMLGLGPLGLLVCTLANAKAFQVDVGGACGRVRPLAGQRLPPAYFLCRKVSLRGGVGALRMVAGSPNTISAVSGVRVGRCALMLRCSSARPRSLAWCPLVRSCPARLRRRTRRR
jgi:hypothetical protein